MATSELAERGLDSNRPDPMLSRSLTAMEATIASNSGNLVKIPFFKFILIFLFDCVRHFRHELAWPEVGHPL